MWTSCSTTEMDLSSEGLMLRYNATEDEHRHGLSGV